MAKTVEVKIKRQASTKDAPRWETFLLPYKDGGNVISLLMEIRRNPVTSDGKPTATVVWDCSCLEEVCGACSMIINGEVRQACSALVDALKHPITLEPLSKFPVIKDLMVDRIALFENLKKVKAWIPIDGTYPAGPGPRMAERDRSWAYELSRCMSCGCCMEACPKYNECSSFMGAAVIAQVRLFNTHPTGEMNKEERLDALMGPGGVAGCSNAQNCEKVCPKKLPLVKSIAEINRAINIHALKRLLFS